MTRACLAFCLAIIVAAAPLAEAQTTAPARKPITIGFLAPLTGPFADAGKDMEVGARLALRKLGNAMAGRPVELLVEDSAANPDVGLSKTRLLVEQRKVSFLTGVYHGGVAMAVAFYAKQKKVPLILSSGGGAHPVMYEVKPQPYVFRTSLSIRGENIPLGHYAASTLGYKTAVSMSADYVAGHDAVEAFTAGFEAGGGKVVKKIYFKVGTADFSPYFAAIPRDVPAVHAMVTGADAIRLVKQYDDLGYRGKFQLITQASATNDRHLPHIGDAAAGLISNVIYSVDLPTPGNSEFVAAYARAMNGKPGAEAAFTYASMFYIARAVEGIGGAVEDTDHFLKALKSTRLAESVRGPIALNDMSDIVFTVRISRVVKEGGGLKHKILKVYDGVDPFWAPPR